MEPTISSLIVSAERGDPSATAALFAALYSELHRLARKQLARNAPDMTIGTTTLLHEAYLDMAQREGTVFPDQGRFMAYAARVMRNLVAERSDAADGAFRRLMAELERQGQGDTRDAALVLNNWSTMLINSGQPLKAVPLSERAVRIARERDSEHGATPVMLRTYGTGLCAVGRCAEAVPIADEAVAKAPSTGSLRRRYGALSTAATIHGMAGNLARAAQLLTEAGRLLEVGRAEMPGQQAVLERRLAQLALLRGDPGAAVALAGRAAAREEDLRIDPVAAMQLMLVLAEAQNERRDFDAARAAADRALVLARPMRGGLEHSSYVGQGLLERGVALAGLGRTAEARGELRKALDHLRATLGPEGPATRRALAQLERLEP